MKREGLVFNIARFSLHDGPGIRTTVFLKGCPLACAWCHNPEGIGARAEIFFRPENCLACGRCVSVCPRTGREPKMEQGQTKPRTAPFPDEACPPGCVLCAEACPQSARETIGTLWDAEKLLGEVLADRAFYKATGGGVTLSGGEPLAQAGFALEFLAACGRAGLHRAVETSGFAPEDVLAEIAGETDLFLFDIKFLDAAAHRRWTGVGNELILRNLEAAARAGRAVRIRRPLIAGVNDGEAEMSALAALAVELGLGVDLLPYHEYAEDKYRKRRKSYTLAGMKPPDEARLARCVDILRGAGAAARIGG